MLAEYKKGLLNLVVLFYKFQIKVDNLTEVNVLIIKSNSDIVTVK